MTMQPRYHANKTGIATARDRGRAMVKAAHSQPPEPIGGPDEAIHERKRYIDAHEPFGSMPSALSQEKIEPEFLMDKLGERLAFERMGVRLYDGLLQKLESDGQYPKGPTRAELEKIRAQELEHFELVQRTIGLLGGDFTAVTPSAALVATESMGIGMVVSDPRTTLPDCLHAILVAELADNTGWEQLCEIAERVGHPDLAQAFERCYEQEREHLESVQSWLQAHSERQIKD
jgi:rubrerythrin